MSFQNPQAVTGLLALSAVLLVAPPATLGEPLWKMLTPVDQVEHHPDGDYPLQQEHGPWLVMAATFSGEGAEGQARELVLELRQHYNIAAYLHSMTFNHTEQGSSQRVGRGVDRYGAPIQMRYRSGDKNREWAVLAGDFPTIDDPAAQQSLERIKQLHPKALDRKPQETTQNLAQEREFLTRLSGDEESGPMRKAFLTRNPLLPAEYFRPTGVDAFVAKMNRGVEHSLLDCPGRYTVKIATFRGHAILQGAMTSSKARTNKEPESDPLVEAAENAHRVTTFLRAKGWPAYEFHDRSESYVTVGSFDQVTRQDVTGGETPIRDVSIIIRTFGAAHQTPSYMNLGRDLDPQNRMRAVQVKQKFNNLFSNEHGQIAEGLQPKFIEYQQGKFIPLDIHPHVIEAPKRSTSSIYAWRR